jgi:transposase
MRQIWRLEEREDFWLIVAFQGAKMRQKSGLAKKPAEQIVKDIRRATRRQFSAEEKIRIARSALYYGEARYGALWEWL